MPGAVDEDFEFLLNLLASDGTEPDPSLGATGSQKAHAPQIAQKASGSNKDRTVNSIWVR